MKYMMHNIASTTWVALNRSRIVLSRFRSCCSCSGLRWALSGVDDLQIRRGIGLGARLQRLHRRVDAAGAVRYARGGQSHLDAGQRPQQGQFVALAEMADAEHLAGELGEAGAERHV